MFKTSLLAIAALVALGTSIPQSHAMSPLYHEGATQLAYRATHDFSTLSQQYKVICTINGALSQTCVDRSLQALAKDGPAGSGYVPTVNVAKQLYPSLAKKLGVK